MSEKMIELDSGLNVLAPVATGFPRAASSRRWRGAASQVALMAGKEFNERFRSGWLIVCSLVWIGAVTFTSFFGLVQMGQLGLQGYERTSVSLLNLAQYLVPLFGLLVGHDLIVREREDRTLHLLLATGLSRGRLVFGKFLGGAFTVGLPLLLGFAIAGAAIGLSVKDRSCAPFLRLAASGLILGVVFCGFGLVISTISRSRVQALVLALLSWGVAVFAFDLMALGIIVSSNAVKASQEIEVLCDATHVNNQADLHAAFDGLGTEARSSQREKSSAASDAWVWLNPVDVFRLLNLPPGSPIQTSASLAGVTALGWMGMALGLATWRFRKIDL